MQMDQTLGSVLGSLDSGSDKRYMRSMALDGSGRWMWSAKGDVIRGLSAT
jgi:hypothetical protein